MKKEKGDRKMKKRFGLVAAGLLALTMAGCSTQIEKGTSLLKEEKPKCLKKRPGNLPWRGKHTGG